MLNVKIILRVNIAQRMANLSYALRNIQNNEVENIENNGLQNIQNDDAENL